MTSRSNPILIGVDVVCALMMRGRASAAATTPPSAMRRGRRQMRSWLSRRSESDSLPVYQRAISSALGDQTRAQTGCRPASSPNCVLYLA